MNKKFFLIFILAILLVLSSLLVHAHCPLCTAAVGATAVSAKYYGLDASIIGLFIGAFAISTGLWIGLKIKKEYFKFQLPIIILSSFLLTILPLLAVSNDSFYFPILLFGSSGSFLNKVYWIDKMLSGSVVGALITLLAYYIHIYIKKINGKVLFPFQGIILTLVFLTMSGVALYFAVGA